MVPIVSQRENPTISSSPAGNGPHQSGPGPTLVDRAYDYLLTMLMSVEIAPGERIAIDTIARQLGISQTPVREALSQLEAERLVFKTTNVGYRASPQMTREEVRDLYTLRQLIEPYAAARAAELMTDESIALLQAIDRDMSDVVDGDARAYSRFAEADAALHRLIATGSGNRLIADTIERLHAHLHIFRALYRTNAPNEAAAEHRRIIDALVAHDAAAAEQAVRAHLERSQQRMDAALATP
ncbi:GntR family transcriptional regulator [Sphingomonas sp.]|uniref:GntR family transcriptional regulator n=1 Tax=Sphingomonas sp. TaxID=28214 RepID=UPI00092778BC|nr:MULTISPECIES: GntR family transcriptional regulator [Sphingomonas]MCW6529113.1 GntR family transcriptional regulator [Sphingomonas lycopersici]OJU17983.1 MAG: GntR family transcriptional regulator [Sphingomonas sp. 66-10]